MSDRVLVDLTIPGSAAWVCLVRRWVADTLTVAGHRDVDDARLVASELAGNAVLHTASGRQGGLVRVKVFGVTDVLARIEVIDEGAATVPHPRRSEDDECGGRGLWLVQQTAIRWGDPDRAAAVEPRMGRGVYEAINARDLDSAEGALA